MNTKYRVCQQTNEDVKHRFGFTLIELLIVIAILAILSTALILLLNPAQMLAQGRDSTRLNDVKVLNNAIVLSKVRDSIVDNTGPKVVYISLKALTVGLDDDCKADYPTLPPLASGWRYRCVPEASLRNINSNGWLPVDFSSVPTIQPPLSILPVDPVNTVNSYYAYGYDSNKDRYAIAAIMDSDKYKNTTAVNDGGNWDIAYETRPVEWFSGGGSPTAALFAGTADDVYKCLVSTNCDIDGEWTEIFGSRSAVTDFAVDTINNVIYLVAAGDTVERCVLSTGCDAPAEWTLAFKDPGSIFFESIVFDSVNGVLYAGGESGRLYRCTVSTGCDGGVPEWPLVLDTAESTIQDIILDTNNNVLYANSRGAFVGSVVYRCPTSTGCDVAGDWATSFNGIAASDSLYEMVFDSANSVIYASGFDFPGAELWRCDVTATSCDANSDWTKPYSLLTTNFVSVLITNGVLYFGEDTSGAGGLRINRCQLSSGCDQQTDFSNYSIIGVGSYIYAIGYDPISSSLYAGTGSFATMYRCPLSSSCDAGADWILMADKPDGDDYFTKILYVP